MKERLWTGDPGPLVAEPLEEAKSVTSHLMFLFASMVRVWEELMLEVGEGVALWHGEDKMSEQSKTTKLIDKVINT